MTIVGMMLVRNEEWILPASIAAALRWVDKLVIGCHNCTDATEKIAITAGAITSRVHVESFQEDDWPEMQQRQRLLRIAREVGGDFMAIIDADEIPAEPLLAGDKECDLRSFAEDTPQDAILQMLMLNLRAGLTRYHSNGIWGNRFVSVGFWDDPRLHWSGTGFHKREPAGALLRIHNPGSSTPILHFWGADETRLIAKHALYKLRERIQLPHKPTAAIEQLYNLAIKDPGTWEFAYIPEAWLPFDPGAVDLGADCWQGREARDIYATDPEYFAGLDLFGVCP
jgi:hypothetical protein